ncbi:MAG: prepilin-type N-terminal cleavage/methylation domain-containing protein [Bdellovibrionota bacterium]
MKKSFLKVRKVLKNNRGMTFLELMATAAIIGIAAQGLMAGFRIYTSMYEDVKIDLVQDRLAATMLAQASVGGAQQTSPFDAASRKDEDLLDSLEGIRFTSFSMMNESQCDAATCPGLIKKVFLHTEVPGMMMMHMRMQWGDNTRDVRVLVPQ